MSNGTPLPPSPSTPAAMRMRMLQRTLVIVFAVVAVVGGLFYWLDVRNQRLTGQRQERARAHVILRPGEETRDWRLKEGAHVEELSRAVEKQNEQLDGLRSQFERLQKQQKLQEEGDAKQRGEAKTRRSQDAQPPVPPLDEILPSLSLKGSSRPPTRQTPVPKTDTASPAATPDAAMSQSTDDTPRISMPAPRPTLPATRPSAPLPHTAAAPGLGRLRVVTPRADAKGAPKAAQTVGWLPSGSFIHGVLLSGVDAGTGTGAGLPYPVLIRLSDPAILPNESKMDLAECFVIGAAFGDLPSERVMIRTETLSCLRKSGGILTIDGDLKGHAIGEDGKLGLRGRVVSKEGAIIARSLVAGFLSGLGQSFRPRISYAPLTLTGNPTSNDSFSLPPLGDSLQAAGISGVGKSMDMLAQYYIAQVQKIFPVIEVDAGRQVDIVVLKGMPLKFSVQRTSAATSGPEVIE